MTNNSQTQIDIENINRLLGEIQKKYAQLGEKSPFKRTAEEAQKGFKDTQSAIKGLEAALKEVNNRILEANTSSKDLKTTLEEVVKEINPKAINPVKDLESGFKKIIEQVKKLHYEEEGINKLSEKELISMQKKINFAKEDAKLAAENLLLSKGIDVLTAEQLQNYNKLQKEKEQTLEKEKKSLEELNSLKKQQTQSESIPGYFSDPKYIENAQKILDIEEELNKLSLDRINKEKELKDISGKINNKTLIDEYQNLDEKIQDNIQTARYFIEELNSQGNTFDVINDKIKKRIELEKDSNKEMGLAGASIEGLDKALGKLGFNSLSQMLGISDAKDEMQDLADRIAKEKQKEKDVQAEIDLQLKKRAEDNKKNLTSAQLRAGFGGKELKNLQLQKDALNSQNAQYSGINGKLAILNKGISVLGANLKKNLTDPTFLAGLLITQLIDALNKADKQTGELAKSFGTSYAEAASLRNELNTIANLSADVNINTASLQKALIELNKQFGTATMLNGELLKDYTRLTEVAGYTTEAAAGLSKITVATGTDLSENTSEILGQAVAFNAVNGLALNEKEIVEGVAKASAATTLSLGMQPKELALAVAQAKALGTTLEKVEQIASSLLNFEQSISSELEAELLIGKDLNLERARMFALNNDMAGVAEEIAKQIGTAADFTEMNVIQQEALAKSVGMTREDLAKSLIEREALAKIGVEDANAAKEKFDKLVEQYGYEKAIKELGDEKYGQQLASQSIQERFNKSIEKLQEIFVSMAEPILQIISPLVDVLTPVLSVISGIVGTIGKGFGQIVKWLSPLIVGLGTFLALSKAAVLVQGAYNAAVGIGLTMEQRRGLIIARNALKSVGDVAVNAYKAIVGIPVVGPVLAPAAAIAAAAAAGALFYKFAKGDDMISPGYGKRTLLAPEGAIALNDKDTVIAGTKLFKGNDVINTNKDTLLSPENTVKLTNNNTIDKNTSSVSKETLDKIISNNNNTIDKNTSSVSKETLDKIISNNNTTIDKTNKIIDGSSYKGNNLGVFENIFKGLNDTISLSLKEDNFQTSTNLVSEPIVSERESRIDNKNVTNNINNQQTNTPSFKDENNQGMIDILSEIKGVLTNINNQKTTTVLEVDGQKLASSFNARTFKIQ